MAQGATSSILQIPAQIPQEQAEHQLEHREGFYLPSLSLPPPSGLETKIPWRFCRSKYAALGRNKPPALLSAGWRGGAGGRNAHQRGVGGRTGMCGHTTGEAAAQPRRSEMKTSSRLYQGFHRDQVLEDLRWNDYVCFEGLGIKITSPSVAWAN